MEEILHFVKHQRTLNFIPGTEHSYSNTGYNILALLIEHISGQSFRSFMNDEIFAPLEMTRTHFQDDHEEIITGRVTGYTSQSGELRRVGNGLMAVGSSSLHTTTEDLLKWVQNFEDRKLASTSVYSMMNMQGQLDDGTAIPYGFGLIQGIYRGLKTVSHSGGWGGFRAVILRIPDHQFTVIVLGNHASLNASVIAERIAEHYLGAFMSPLSEPTTPSEGEFLPSDYEGIYDFGKAHVVRLTAGKTSLFAHLPPSTKMPVQSLGTDSLRVPAFDLTLTFVRDSLGQVTRAFSQGREAVRSPLPKKASLSSFEGCYKSEELEVSYSIHAQDGLLTVTGPRGKNFVLKKATANVFTSDLWFMPVIRFYVDPNIQTAIRLEANSPRNQKVIFKKDC